MTKWIKSGTTGVRYRQHSTRKHGVRFDRYFSIRYRVNGKQKEEGLGWASEGWSEKKAAAILSELKANKTTGTGPLSLTEKRQLEEERRTEETRQEDKERRASITFAEIFIEHFLPYSKANKRSKRSWEREDQIFRVWIAPCIGNKPLRQIRELQLEGIKRAMTRANRAPRTIQYALAVVRQVFNHAINNKLFYGPNPAAGKAVQRPKVDNERRRFLTREEQTALLSELAKRSADVHDMALFSLHTGARAGEIFSLTWRDVDPFTGTALLRNTKSGKDRYVYLTNDLKRMLIQRKSNEAKKNDLVFPGKGGNRIAKISNSYARTVDKIKLNEDVSDPKLKTTFHTLRHTYASMLVQAGADIYQVKKLLGHSTIALTERYSHLDDDGLKKTAMLIQTT